MSDVLKLKYKPLIGQTIPDLESFAESQGEKPFRGRQLFDWIYRQQVDDVSAMTDLSKPFREKLANILIHPLKMITEDVSVSKQTQKILLNYWMGICWNLY